MKTDPIKNSYFINAAFQNGRSTDFSDGRIDVCSYKTYYEASLECIQNPCDQGYLKKSVLFGTSSAVEIISDEVISEVRGLGV